MIDNTVTAAAPGMSEQRQRRRGGGTPGVIEACGQTERIRAYTPTHARIHSRSAFQDHGCIVNGVLQVYSSSFWQKNYLDKTASKKYSRLHRFHARRNPAPHIILCSGSYGPIPDSIQAR
ncbi:hypothetical protein J6590_050605 [Homalodisca vitripennis]|nr:hypothetical protein J6590_050605 [Homalodisca vitripennis]